jgi:hypothetical protein
MISIFYCLWNVSEDFTFFLIDKKIEQLLSLRKTEKRLGNRNLDGPPNICKVQPSSGFYICIDLRTLL